MFEGCKAPPFERIEITFMGCPVLLLSIGLACRALVTMAETAACDLNRAGVVIEADFRHDLTNQMRMEVDTGMLFKKTVHLKAERPGILVAIVFAREKPAGGAAQ